MKICSLALGASIVLGSSVASASAQPVASNWQLYGNDKGCIFKSLDNKVTILFSPSLFAVGITDNNISNGAVGNSAPMTVQFSGGGEDITNLPPEIDQATNQVFGSFVQSDTVKILKELQASKDSDTITVSIGNIAKTENLAGASENLPYYLSCMQEIINHQ